MPDARDSYQYLKDSSRGVLADMAELAARLGSPNAFIRTGVTVFQDTFEDGITGWHGIGGLNGSIVRISLDEGEFGGCSANLHAQGDDLGEPYLYKYFAVPELQRFGVELGAKLPDDFDHFTFFINIGSSLGEYECGIRYVPSVTQFQYMVSTSTYQHFATFDLDLSANDGFDRFKLVVDLEANEYVSFRYNQNYWSLADIPFNELSTDSRNWMSIKILTQANSGDEVDFYVDYILLTTAEL